MRFITAQSTTLNACVTY